MTAYKKESHLRSVIKGISWRIIATADTIAVVLLVTCLYGECSIESAIKIGFLEFFVKLVVYYVHERIWQNLHNGKIITKTDTFKKAISWRIVATTMTFIISGAILDSFDKVALSIALTELFTKFALYYLHERLWLKLPLGRIRRFFFKSK